MLAALHIFIRNTASYVSLLFAVVCLIWLAKLRDEHPEANVGWEGVSWHEEEAREVVQEGQNHPHSESDFVGPPEPELAHYVDDSISSLGFVQPGMEYVPPKRQRPLVVVDAGHGAEDGGAVWNGIIEKDLALMLAKKVKSELNKLNIDVEMTRSTDIRIPLEQRALKADRLRADAFVSLHLNSAGNQSGVRGIETYYCTEKSLRALRLMQLTMKLPSIQGLKDRRGEKLANVVQRHVCETTGASNRGTKERAYTVVQMAACPAILVECGFISNPKEASQLKSVEYQNKLAAGLARGISTFLLAQKADPMIGIEMAPPPPLEALPAPKTEQKSKSDKPAPAVTTPDDGHQVPTKMPVGFVGPPESLDLVIMGPPYAPDRDLVSRK